MPTMASRLPTSLARWSACFRLASSCASSWSRASPHSGRGGMLISMLNRPSSGAQDGSPIASSTSGLRIDAVPESSTRLTSTSRPTCRVEVSNQESRSIRASTSRH